MLLNESSSDNGCFDEKYSNYYKYLTSSLVTLIFDYLTKTTSNVREENTREEVWEPMSKEVWEKKHMRSIEEWEEASKKNANRTEPIKYKVYCFNSKF